MVHRGVAYRGSQGSGCTLPPKKGEPMPLRSRWSLAVAALATAVLVATPVAGASAVPTMRVAAATSGTDAAQDDGSGTDAVQDDGAGTGAVQDDGSGSAAPTPAPDAEQPDGPGGGPTPSETTSPDPGVKSLTDTQPTGPTTPLNPVPGPKSSPPSGGGTPVPAKVYDRSGKVPTLDIYSPDGKPNEINKVKADKKYKSPGWKAEFTTTLGGTRDLPLQQDVELKGRGNATWCYGTGKAACNLRLPLQVKFSSKVDMLSDNPLLTKNDDNANKAWVLLPNEFDATFMRNKLMYDYAKAIGMDNAPESRFVDVRMDGKYLGAYLLVEKVEVKSGRVNMKNPNGVLVELDNKYWQDEIFNFAMNDGSSHFALKDAVSGDSCDKDDIAANKYVCVPGNSKVSQSQCNAPDANGKYNENCLPSTTKSGWDDVKSAINAFNTELVKPVPDWNSISSKIDVDSFLKFFFVFDLGENSAIPYFYKDGPTDTLHAGPVWDFDTTVFNSNKGEGSGTNPEAEFSKTGSMLRMAGKQPATTSKTHNTWFYDLYRNPEFVQMTNDMWLGTGTFAGKTPVRDATAQVIGNVNGAWDQLVGTTKDAPGSALLTHSKIGGVLGSSRLSAAFNRSYLSTYGAETAYLCTPLNQRVQLMDRTYGAVPLLQIRGGDGLWGSSTPAWVNNGQMAGTFTKKFSKFEWSLNGANGVAGWTGSGDIVAKVVTNNGATKTATGKTGKVEDSSGIKTLTLSLTPGSDLDQQYKIQYRAITDLGLQSWKDASSAAGSQNGNKLVGVQVRLVQKTVAPVATASCYDFKAKEAQLNATSDPNQVFKDLPSSNPFFTQVNWLGSTGIATGTPLTSANGNLLTENFRPTDMVTREVTAAWMYRYANPQDYTAPATSPFADVKTSDPNYKAIAWLYENTLSTGWQETNGTVTFRPKTNIERAAIAAFFLRYARLTGAVPATYVPNATPRFKDVPTSDQFYAEIDWFASTGLTTGWSDGTFRPHVNTERVAMAAFFARYADEVAAH